MNKKNIIIYIKIYIAKCLKRKIQYLGPRQTWWSTGSKYDCLYIFRHFRWKIVPWYEIWCFSYSLTLFNIWNYISRKIKINLNLFDDKNNCMRKYTSCLRRSPINDIMNTFTKMDVIKTKYVTVLNVLWSSNS